MSEEKDDLATTSEVEKLTKNERIVAALIAGLCLIVAALLTAFPPSVSQAITLTSCATAQDCVVAVDADVTPYVLAMLALAGVAALLALLGVRFTKISLGQYVNVGSATEVEQVPKQAAGAGGGAGALAAARAMGEEVAMAGAPPPQPDPAAWNNVPSWVKDGVLEWAQDNPDKLSNPDTAIIDAAKPGGQGNHAWYVDLLGDTGPMTLRIGTGKGGISQSESSSPSSDSS